MTTATRDKASTPSTPAEAGTVETGEAVSRLSLERIWRELAAGSFAVLGYVTPRGEPRSSGVVYKALRNHLYVAVAPDSWKAKDIAISGRVSVTVPVRRGGVLSLIIPIPPATISFHATAIVYAPGSKEMEAAIGSLGSLLPPERRGSASIIEVIPEGMFVTYGVGVSLKKMLDPIAARARVAVG